jgi:hypothetical protein
MHILAGKELKFQNIKRFMKQKYAQFTTSMEINATQKLKNSKMLKGQLTLKVHFGVLSKLTDL